MTQRIYLNFPQNGDGEKSVTDSGSAGGVVGHGQPQPPSAAVHSSAATTAASSSHSFVSSVIVLLVVIVTMWCDLGQWWFQTNIEFADSTNCNETCQSYRLKTTYQQRHYIIIIIIIIISMALSKSDIFWQVAIAFSVTVGAQKMIANDARESSLHSIAAGTSVIAWIFYRNMVYIYLHYVDRWGVKVSLSSRKLPWCPKEMCVSLIARRSLWMWPGEWGTGDLPLTTSLDSRIDFRIADVSSWWMPNTPSRMNVWCQNV